MAKAKDLTGQRFGRLTVLRLADTPYITPTGKATRRWVCRCDCGKETIVVQNALTTTTNGTRSCGCLLREHNEARAQDLTGQRFGRLLVLHSAPLSPKKQSSRLKNGWLCRCDCGKEVIYSQKKLVLEHVQSCGCLVSDNARKNAVENNVFGRCEGTTVTTIRPSRPANSNSKSGVKGVHWSNRDSCWIAKIGFQGRTIYLGHFSTLEEAKKARAEAEEKYYAPILERYDKLPDTSETSKKKNEMPK